MTAHVDADAALARARGAGRRSLLALDFQQRAARLKALAEVPERAQGDALRALAPIPARPAATAGSTSRAAPARCTPMPRIGAHELPSGNLVHEGPAMPLGKKGGFAGTHILVPRGGLAVHINAFNFPVWGLLEKFAPTFLAGMPCIGKPATSTSYLTEAAGAADRSSRASCPTGSLQLVIGSTGDLLDRLRRPGRGHLHRLGRHRGRSCACIRTCVRAVDSVQRRSRLAQLRHPRRRTSTPDDEEFDLFVKEVAREMTVKAGQKCTAIRRAIVPRQHLDAVAERLRERLAKIVVGDPARGRRRAWARWPRMRSSSDVGRARWRCWREGAEIVGVRRRRDGFSPVGEGVADGAFFAPTLLLSRDPLEHDAVARGRGVRPGQHADAVRRTSTRRWRWPRAAAAAWSRRW